MKTKKRSQKNKKIDIAKLSIVVVTLLFWTIVIVNEEYVSECVFKHSAVASKVCGR